MNNYQENEYKSRKICAKCNCEKNIIDFYKYNSNKCKSCIIYYEKEYRIKNKDKILKYQKEYKEDNKDDLRNKKSIYDNLNRNSINKIQKEKYKNNLQYKLSCILRKRIRDVLKSQNTTKDIKTSELIGCTKQQYIKHIESQFKEGMTWKNHCLKGWHIDHIKPMASFDLSNPEQLKECCHYTNMQPLWAIDNLKKGDKYLP